MIEITNTTECCICGEIVNLKSDDIEFLDDLPAHAECVEKEKDREREYGNKDNGRGYGDKLQGGI